MVGAVQYMDVNEVLNLTDTDAKALEFVNFFTSNPQELQDSVLEHILDSNAGIEYFRRYDIDGVPSCQEFRTKLPIITYKHIESDVQRIAMGDKSGILCSEPIQQLLSSSGTSGGKPKLFPKLPSYDQEFLVLNRVARAMINSQAPQTIQGKSMQFIYCRAPGRTSGGVETGSGLSGYFTSDAFLKRRVDPDKGFTSPDEVIISTDYEQSSYCHLLCGLAQFSQVVRIGAVFASTFVRTIKTLRNRWHELCDDLRSGEPSPDRVPDPVLRRAVREKVLQRIPFEQRSEIAAAVARECSAASWQGIVRRLWPDAVLVESIITGSMQQYIATIDWLTEGLPIASSLYAGSECSTLGVNLDPFPSSQRHSPPVSYSLFPCFAYYEFLPVANRDSILTLSDVQYGEEYELVVTTKAGLYRYQVGDVLRVTGFHNNAPTFEFVRRAGVVLSVDTDKTDERDLHIAVTRACASLRCRSMPRVLASPRPQNVARLVDYTSRVDLTSEAKGHYVLYWELLDSETILDELQLGICCDNVEKSLSDVYKRNRREGIIGPLKIKLVDVDTFEALAEYVVSSRNGSIAQYKAPRCVSDSAMIRILESRVIMVASASEKS